MSRAPISIVIPVLNVETTIEEQLGALARQVLGTGSEVLIVDNGCTDTTLEVVERWRATVPALRIVDVSARRGVFHARNEGVRAARFDRIAFCDGDDVVGPGWVDAMTAGLDTHDLVTGPVDLVRLNPLELYAWRPSPGWSVLPRWHRFLPSAMGCNLGTTRRAFDALGGFDGSVDSGEDFDFVWRAQLAGFELGVEAGAVVHWRVNPAMRRYWRHHLAYGAADVHLFRRFGHAGMPRSSVLWALADYAWLLFGMPRLVSPRGRYQWVDKASLRAGRLVGSFRLRTLYL